MGLGLAAMTTCKGQNKIQRQFAFRPTATARRTQSTPSGCTRTILIRDTVAQGDPSQVGLLSDGKYGTFFTYKTKPFDSCGNDSR